MKKHNFCYNYGFLADWFKANPDIKKYGVKDTMGMSYYKTCQNWFDGETMMPLTQMMKFCNLYNVPITAFFYDDYADSDSVFSQLHPNAMIEPNGGWKESDRKAGIKTGDPRTTEHYDSNLPDYCKTGIININIVEGKTGAERPNPEQDDVTHEERMRYLDIIKDLSDRMMQLSDENIKLKEELMKLRSHGTRNYAMVAEDLPEYNS